MSRDRHARLSDTATIAGFILLLWLPGVASVWQADVADSHSEQRNLAPFPEPGTSLERWQTWPERLSSYYDDHLGFRDDLIRMYSWLWVETLGQAPVPEVIVGKEGWFFLGDDHAVAQHRGVVRTSAEHLERWRVALEARRDWLRARGSEYLLVLVPNKHTVYADKLPNYLAPVSEESQLGALVEYLEDRSDIEVLDLREALAQARAREPNGDIYHKTDTHWNDLGAYAASRAIVTALNQRFPELGGLESPPVRRRVEEGPGLGLPQILGLAGSFPQRATRLEPWPARARVAPEFQSGYEARVRRQRPFAFETGRAGLHLPRAVVLRDSFANALIPYLSESFARTLYVWTRAWPERLLERELPELVIQEIAERFLGEVPAAPGSSRRSETPGPRAQ